LLAERGQCPLDDRRAALLREVTDVGQV